MYADFFSGATLQQFKIFLSAAKHENFTKAAEELNMTQASVSRNIADLENMAGLLLFARHKRRVHLTPAGKQLAEDLKRLKRQFSNVVDKAFEIQAVQHNTLRIGDISTTSSNAYLIPAIERFETLYPDIRLSISRVEPNELAAGLEENLYDIVFSPGSARKRFEHLGMKFVPVADVMPCIMIGRRHPLFQKEQLSLEDFAGNAIVRLVGNYHDEYWNSVLEHLKCFGYSTTDARYVENLHMMSYELQRGECIAIMDVFYASAHRHNLRYVEIPCQAEIFSLGLVYSPENYHPYIKKFIACARHAMAET